MMNSSNSEYAITHENELAYVLSKFENDFVYSTVIESLNNKLRNYSNSIPNIVNAFEQNFISIKADFPGDSAQIIDVRNDTYENIIRILCDSYQLVYNNDDVDVYTAASTMYSFLVSDFQKLIVSFFVNFINKEKNGLYDMCKLQDQKKNKDVSTIYSKKYFKNPKMAVISANLDSVITNICRGFDITLDTYISVAYGEDNKEIINFLNTTISPVNDFFRTYIASVFETDYKPIILTSIRLELQQTNMGDVEIDITTT